MKERSDDCGRQIDALKNGRDEGSCPIEMCHEGSAINILIKASQALENPPQQPAFSTLTGAKRSFLPHINQETFRLCQFCIVRVLGLPKE